MAHTCERLRCAKNTLIFFIQKVGIAMYSEKLLEKVALEPIHTMLTRIKKKLQETFSS